MQWWGSTPFGARQISIDHRRIIHNTADAHCPNLEFLSSDNHNGYMPKIFPRASGRRGPRPNLAPKVWIWGLHYIGCMVMDLPVERAYLQVGPPQPHLPNHRRTVMLPLNPEAMRVPQPAHRREGAEALLKPAPTPALPNMAAPRTCPIVSELSQCLR